MIDFIQALPGWLIGHPFLAAIIGIAVLGAAYLVVLKIAMAIEGVKDIKRRNPDRDRG